MDQPQPLPVRREAGEDWRPRQGREPQDPPGSHLSLLPLCPRPEPLPGVLSERCPLIPVWEAEQGDGSEQPLLLLLLAPKQVLPLNRKEPGELWRQGQEERAWGLAGFS